MTDSTVGVPLMVHVLLSIFKPVGREGETVQVAPVTLVMPPPEPLPEPLLSEVISLGLCAHNSVPVVPEVLPSLAEK